MNKTIHPAKFATMIAADRLLCMVAKIKPKGKRGYQDLLKLGKIK